MKDNNRKDAYWFSHDSNAKDDPKCMLLIDQLGLEGYGIYWVLVEILREQPDFSYPLALVPAIAKRYGTSAQKVETVIRSFGLFGVMDEKFFYSQSLITRVLAFKEKQDKKTAAALKANMLRWEAERERKEQNSLPPGVQTESERSPNGVQSESDFIPIKGKEIKEKENISPLSKDKELCPTPSVSDSELPLPLPQSENPKPESEAEVLSNKHCQQVVDFWNRKISETAASYRPIKLLTDKRKAKIRTRWKEFAKLGSPVDVCRTIFEKACASKFMQGDNTRGWTASFDWIFDTEKNWIKVYEGQYDGKPIVAATGASLDDLYRQQLEEMRKKYGTAGTDTGYSGFPEEQ